jgi:hypothetical protein
VFCCFPVRPPSVRFAGPTPVPPTAFSVRTGRLAKAHTGEGKEAHSRMASHLLCVCVVSSRLFLSLCLSLSLALCAALLRRQQRAKHSTAKQSSAKQSKANRRQTGQGKAARRAGRRGEEGRTAQGERQAGGGRTADVKKGACASSRHAVARTLGSGDGPEGQAPRKATGLEHTRTTATGRAGCVCLSIAHRGWRKRGRVTCGGCKLRRD